MTDSAPTQTPMDKASVQFLASYLLLWTILTGYLIFSLWSARPRLATSQSTAPDCTEFTKPKLTAFNPASVSTGSTVADILVLGCQFTPSTQVKLNGSQRAAVFI